MELLTSDDIFKKVKEIVQSAQSSVKIASAWIKGRHFEELIDIIKQKDLEVEVVIRASELRDLTITDSSVFESLRRLKNLRLYLCKRLHAKFIIVDDKKAVVGSANFTDPGLSDISTGNIEACVYYEDDAELNKLVEYFRSIKEEHSEELSKDLIGFVLNPVKPESFEFILLSDDVELQSYVEVRLKEGQVVLGKVKTIYAYDMGFFANPFTSSESQVFAPFEDFKRIFDKDKTIEWIISAIYAYVNSNGNGVKIATVEVIGVLKDGRLDLLRKPFNVGEPVYRASEGTLKQVLVKKSSGEDMSSPIRVGFIKGSQVPVYIDGDEVIEKHMLVVGTTGSGKSYFAKKFICNILRKIPDLQVYILDPHGEYFKDLAPCVQEENIEHIEFEDTLLPVYPDELEEHIENLGYPYLVSGNSKLATNNRGIIAKYVKSSIRYSKLKEMTLEDLLRELKYSENTNPQNKSKSPQDNSQEKTITPEELINQFKEVFGDKAVCNQPETFEKIEQGLRSDKRVKIFNFRRITNAQTRVNIAGLIMQELFNESKMEFKKRLLILEEAHNFAPEKGYGEVSSSKDNLSLTYAKKIASEGRKFKLGLIVITQRPAQVSKYVLSQLNTQAMFRTINNSDIDALSTTIEYAGSETSALLPFLPTGNAIISGLGVPMPLLVQVES